MELYKDIYFFNLTNPEEFEKGATPVVVEVGPYRYRCAVRWIGAWGRMSCSDCCLLSPSLSRETRVKTPNMPRGYSHTEGNTLMPYTQRKYFIFDRQRTPANLHEEDVITTINFPLVVRPV